MTCHHSCLFTLQVAERGPWQVVGMTCKTRLLQSTIRTKHIRIGYVGRPDVMWRSSGCYVCECRVPLLEGVWIGEARHVYSWGNPDGGNPDENACHVLSGNVCHVSSGGGVPTMPPFLTCRFCLSKMGRLKNNCFLKQRLLFCAYWATWRAGAKREKSIYDEPPSLGIPRQRVASMMV